MLNYNEIKPGIIVDIDGVPFEVLWTSGIVKKQRQKPHLSAKLKDMQTGSLIEKTFTQSDKLKEASLEEEEMKFIYSHKERAVFANPNNPSKRIEIDKNIMKDQLPFIKENDIVIVQIFNNAIIGIKIPIKVSLRVIEAPPNIRGNTSAGGNKVVVTETGLKVTTPLFIEEGDVIIVNTQTGEYISRQ